MPKKCRRSHPSLTLRNISGNDKNQPYNAGHIRHRQKHNSGLLPTWINPFLKSSSARRFYLLGNGPKTCTVSSCDEVGPAAKQKGSVDTAACIASALTDKPRCNLGWLKKMMNSASALFRYMIKPKLAIVSMNGILTIPHPKEIFMFYLK
jgi:hypothetical protein